MTTMRYLCLAVPVALTLLATLADRRRGAGAPALLAFLAAAVGLAVMQELARWTGWYSFAPVDGSFRGMPVDLWIGWAALWGPIPVLLRRVLPLPIAMGLLLWIDVVAMPCLHPLVRLGPDWLLGEAVGLLFVALPAQLLGRWSAERRRLHARVLLQVGVFAAMALWLVPTVAFELGDGSWTRLFELPAPLLLITAQVALLVAVPALVAVREFAVRGSGTPYPWDPPTRLVTTGPYAYVANPMQLSAVGLLLLLAAVTLSASLVLAAVGAAAFSVAVAGPHERETMTRRYGEQWCGYRRNVSNWRARWTPYRPAGPGDPARLWLDHNCPECAGVAGFFRARQGYGLELATVVPDGPPLWRARYADGDGHNERGVAAVARGLEHINLGWAYVGWVLRLPMIGWLAQVVTDAMIAPPHPAHRPPRRAATHGEERYDGHKATPAGRRARRHP